MNVNNILKKIKITPIIDSLLMEKIDDNIYFSEKYNDYISNSRLTLLNSKSGGSCQKFLDGLGANNNYNASFLLGSGVHCMTLQPELFMITPPLARPSAKAGMMADIIYEQYKDHLPTIERLRNAALKTDYYHGMPTQKQLESVRNKMVDYIKNRCKFDENNTDTREVIYMDDKLIETTNKCVEALSNNPVIQNLLHPEDLLGDLIVENEQAIILTCKVEAPGLDSFEIKLKSKLDNYVIDPTNNIITINDVKTHGRPMEKFLEAVTQYSYFREMAFYATLLKLGVKKNFNMDNPEIYSNFLAVQTYDPYETQVVTMTDELWKKGQYHFMYLLRLAALAMYFKNTEEYDEYTSKL